MHADSIEQAAALPAPEESTPEPQSEPESDADAEAELTARDDRLLLAGYGENELSVRNIPLGSGTVGVHGSGIPSGHTVWVAGKPVPTDEQGNFVAEVILPDGAHTVEVGVLDEEGNGELFLRDLEFERNDWFYLGLADLTLSAYSTDGPADALVGDDAPYDPNSTADGRLAFYVAGKFRDDWRLTASADTREAPVEELFSNFMDKSPESLFRRIDPDYHYPTFGDDGIVEESAPTEGKFYVKLQRHESHALWGNFNVGYAGNDLARVDRGLYGSNVHYQSQATTRFGEQQFAVDGFAAEPGTIGSREEFRGTGGSLYFLGRQDILTGSEQVRIEVRDKDSGIVTGVVNLRPVLDYDIDYLQGRILLAEPLESTVDDNLLVRNAGLSGDESWLVVNYEYTPGFDDTDALSTGGQGHYWLNEHVRVGLTASSNDSSDTSNSSLNAADMTLRKSADTWFKLQAGQSEGLATSNWSSNDGGFEFAGTDEVTFDGVDADAYRSDLSLGIGDFFHGAHGRVRLYAQTLDGGYSAPSLTTLTDTEQYGGSLTMPVTKRLELGAKANSVDQQEGLETSAAEVDVGFKLTEQWSLNTGVRRDDREDHSPVVPVTQQQGERTDAVLQLAYDSKSRWRSYGFVQDTLSTTGDREDNGRLGIGGAYRFNDHLMLQTEVSDGDLGPAGKLGSNYLLSDRTSLYLNYALESESTDGELPGRRGNLTAGGRRQLSDTTSFYSEERYQQTSAQTGLTHATGISLSPTNRWSFGASSDIGTLTDRQTGAETKRTATGVRAGYGWETVQLSSAVEYRFDETEQLDGLWSDRKSWLWRNSLKYQLTPDWRLVGKLNYSDSNSSLGEYYDGGYTEAVLGYAFRPVANDRLSALAKYTYF